MAAAVCNRPGFLWVCGLSPLPLAHTRARARAARTHASRSRSLPKKIDDKKDFFFFFDIFFFVAFFFFANVAVQLGGVAAGFVGYKVNQSAQRKLLAEYLERERTEAANKEKAHADEVAALKAEIARLKPQPVKTAAAAAAAPVAAKPAGDDDWIDDWMDSASDIVESGKSKH